MKDTNTKPNQFPLFQEMNDSDVYRNISLYLSLLVPKYKLKEIVLRSLSSRTFKWGFLDSDEDILIDFGIDPYTYENYIRSHKKRADPAPFSLIPVQCLWLCTFSFLYALSLSVSSFWVF